METIKLAIISDIHVGLDARGKDLCPEPPPVPKTVRNKYDRKPENAYRQKFVNYIRQEGITADYLVLPGDLTNKAHPPQVAIASEFILQAANALEVPHDKIVFSPGNHDVDWSRYDSTDTTGTLWQQRYNNIGHSNYHFRQLVDQGHGDIFLPPHFNAWNFGDLLAISYNSASHDSPVPEDEVHHGLIDPDDLDAIREYLESIDLTDDCLRLFLVHHHPIEFVNPIHKIPDFSLMTNAENLLALLHEHNFDLIIHGHKHHPRFETHSTQTYPHLPIFCSGSFSIEIDSGWAGTITNQFHLVMVEGRAGTGNRIRGKIMNWANTNSRGWFPSEELSCGIHHIVPFGNYVTPEDLDSILEPFIREKFTRYDCVLWKHVLREFPELEHLPVQSSEAAFKRLAITLDCEIFLNTSIHGLMLSRKD